MDKLVKALGVDVLSKSQVSRMAADLASIVEDFRHRPLGEAGKSPWSLQRAHDEGSRRRSGINAVVLGPHPLRVQPDGRDRRPRGPRSRRCSAASTTSPTQPRYRPSFDRLLDYVQEKVPAVFEHLDRARADLLSFAAVVPTTEPEIGADDLFALTA